MVIKLSEDQKQKVENILSQMTLEEKLGQLNLQNPSLVGAFDVPFEEIVAMLEDGRISEEEFLGYLHNSTRDFNEDEIRAGRISAMGISEPEKINELQKIAVEESRLGIPLLIGMDVIHGHRTVYPIPLAEACSFDLDLMRQTARMAARESRMCGINWHYAPMVDLARDARWGRVAEVPGEDPCLGKVFAEAKIRGLQEPDDDSDAYVAACLKHYVGYGAVEAGRDYNTVSMALHQLYNNYLCSFRSGVDAGAQTVMSAFHDFNGVPCTTNRFLLRDLLKDKMNFEGFVVSDANAIKECVTHGSAQDETDAGVQAINAGLDMDMGTGIFKDKLMQPVQQRQVPMEVLDDAVRRILQVKMWLGLFDKPYLTEEEIHRYDQIPAQHTALALKAAEESIVLLKNQDNLLPLATDAKIALVGTLADKKEEVVGSWAMGGKDAAVSLRAGLEDKFGNLQYFPCGGPEGDLNEEEADAAAAYGDVIVAVLGELKDMSGEGASQADITLPGRQRELLRRLADSGKPVVLVLMNGRPLALDWEAEHIPAIVEAWQLGVQMGNAVANVLAGDVAPQGKLSISFPYKTGQCPVYYNRMNTGRPGKRGRFTSKYYDIPAEPLYPFGYGLTYTTFALDGLQVTDQGDALEISVQVQNTGSRSGVETVQFYMRDVAASLVRPIKELKGFRKVRLDAGEKTVVRFAMPKQKMGFYDNEGVYHLEDGTFQIFAGTSSEDCLSQDVEILF